MTDVSECNCGNCTNPACELSNQSLEHAKQFEILSVGRIMTMRCTTEIHGCLSHPKSREVLMAPVIKELETRIAETENARKKTDILGGNLLVHVYRDMITLITEGVKKDELSKNS